MAGTVLLALRILLLIALYTLVAAVLYGLFRDIRQHSQRLSIRQTPPLILISASDHTLDPFTFTRSQITLGRSPACDCIVDQETISSVHARFSYRQGHWWLEDMNSTNGTFINDEPITMPVVLTESDRLKFGDIEYLIGPVLS